MILFPPTPVLHRVSPADFNRVIPNLSQCEAEENQAHYSSGVEQEDNRYIKALIIFLMLGVKCAISSLTDTGNKVIYKSYSAGGGV